MTVVWPRLPGAAAAGILAGIADSPPAEPATSHPAQIWSAVGERVDEQQVRDLLEAVTACAGDHGFPAGATNAQRVAFDRAAAVVVRERMHLTWAEAGTGDTWSFLALVVLPDVTRWRFGMGNTERWIASDLTRHTWARLWWHAESFGDDVGVLAMLGESDLNQILERRSIGGNPHLVRAFSRALSDFDVQGAPRRLLVRDVTKRLLRRLAYVDGTALDMDALIEMCRDLLGDSAEALGRDPENPQPTTDRPVTDEQPPARRSWLGRRRHRTT